ncbi:MAG: putative nucleotidyltransferase with HDIG domain [Desulforhopalus sp.]
MKHKDTFHEKLSSIKLPQLPQVLIQLIDICRSEEVDIRLVAQTVAQDIAITTKTLKLANSAFLGARSQFRNIDQAVIFLGINTVRNLAISVSIHDVFDKNKPSHGLDSEQFWYHSLLTALLSKSIAQKSGYDDPGAAYLAGLLHDTGKHLLCDHFGKDYQTLIKNKEGSADLVAAEKKTYEISHCDVGKCLLDSWNMSEEFGNAVRDHHNVDSQDSETSILSRIVRLANTLTRKVETYDEQTIKDVSILCISPSVLPTIIEEQTAILEDLAQTLGISIKEPEPVELSRKREQEQQRLSNEVALRSQLYGSMDNIIQAQTINRVFLVLEETLSFLFQCEESFLLLPDQTGQILVPQGSFRNIIAQNLKGQKYALAADYSYSDDNAGEHRLTLLKKTLTLSVGAKNSPLSSLFEVTNKEILLAVPVRISQNQQGLLFLGLSPDNQSIRDQEESLLLLATHVGNRFYQEVLKEEYAANFAKERIAAIEDMARSLAHEISNPLGVIQNYISLLAEKDGQTMVMSQELSVINKEINRITKISKQLGNLSTPPEPVHNILTDINQVIMDTVNLFQKSIPPEARISLDFTPAADMPDVWMEVNALKQILGNLIGNSIDAVGDTGAIEVHCHHVPETGPSSPGEIVITVSDNGPGVPPSISNTIFRAGKTTKDEGHAGLGLAIVNKLTKDISGRIYHSTGKQGNTQFTLHFPTQKQHSS